MAGWMTYDLCGQVAECSCVQYFRTQVCRFKVKPLAGFSGAKVLWSGGLRSLPYLFGTLAFFCRDLLSRA